MHSILTYVCVYIALSVLSSQRTCLTNKYRQEKTVDYFREITLSSLSYLYFITSLQSCQEVKTRDNAVAMHCCAQCQHMARPKVIRTIDNRFMSAKDLAQTSNIINSSVIEC